MKDSLYLLNATISGIKSIEKPVSISFYKKGINREFNPEKYRVKAIYGENGAGKTALITAISIFKNLVINEDYLSDASNQKLLKELINKKTRRFRFECEFLNKMNKDIWIFKYCIELLMNEKEKYEISYEHLERKNGNYTQSKYINIFECKSGKLLSAECDQQTLSTIDRLSFNLLSSKSMEAIFLSNFEAFKVRQTGDIFTSSTLVCAVLALLTKVYLVGEDRHELYFIQKKLNEELSKDEVSSELSECFNKCLIEFSGVNEKQIARSDFERYRQKVSGLTQFIKLFKNELVDINIDSKEHGDYLECELVLDYGSFKIAKEFESTGIKKLIDLYDSLVTASNGGIVFIDEMDSNINDVYLCRMIEFFMYYGQGQLCFTTHNIDPMNVLQENKLSIEFLSNDNILIPWKSKGNATPENYYRNGLIANLPFNITATDFVGILGG